MFHIKKILKFKPLKRPRKNIQPNDSQEEDLQEIDYEELGRGAYSKVYKFDENRVLKVIEMDDEFGYCTMRELEILKNTSHPNLLKVGSINRFKNNFVVVLPYMKSDLVQYIYSNLKFDIIYEISKQIVSALQYLHSERICHRDLKPENIMVDVENKKIYLIDFSLSKVLYDDYSEVNSDSNEVHHSTIVATKDYRPPELIVIGSKRNEYEPYDPYAVDVWSLGCIFLEFLRDETLFECTSNKFEVYHKQKKFFKSDVDDYVKDIYLNDEKYLFYKKLIQDTLREDPKDRISINEIASRFGLSPIIKEEEKIEFSPINDDFLYTLIEETHIEDIFHVDTLKIDKNHAYSYSKLLFDKIKDLELDEEEKYIACFSIYLKMFYSIVAPLMYILGDCDEECEVNNKENEIKIFEYLNYKIFY